MFLTIRVCAHVHTAYKMTFQHSASQCSLGFSWLCGFPQSIVLCQSDAIVSVSFLQLNIAGSDQGLIFAGTGIEKMDQTQIRS